MYLDKIYKDFLKNGFVVLKNFFDKDCLSKIEKTVKSHISFHLHKHAIGHIKDVENEGIIKLELVSCVWYFIKTSIGYLLK